MIHLGPGREDSCGGSRQMLLCGLLAAFISSGVAADTLKLRADYWCPYNCDPTSEKPGVLIEIAQKALEGTPHQLDYQLLNWSRAKLEAEMTQAHGLVGMGWDEELAQKYQFTLPLMDESPWCFYVKARENWRYTGLSSLTGVMLGVVNGYGYTPEMDEFLSVPANRPYVVSLSGDRPIKNLLTMLMLSRIQVLLDERNVVRYEASEKGLNLKEAGCLNDDSENNQATKVYITFSRDDAGGARWIRRINRKLEALQQNGEYAGLLKRYGLSP